MADDALPLPPGIDREPFRTFAALAAEQLRRIDAALPRLAVHRVDDVDAGILPLLGWQMHLFGEGWNLADNEERRRALIRDAIPLHRMKGTPEAVTRAVAALGFGGVRVVEARPELLRDGSVRRDGSEVYGDRARWATFRVRVDAPDRGLDASTAKRLADVIDHWKPARSHLAALGVTLDTSVGRDAPMAAAMALRIGLSIAARRPALRDGRLRRGGWEPVLRDGAQTYDGTMPRAGREVAGPVFQGAALATALRVGLHLAVRRRPGPPRDGAVLYDSRCPRDYAGPVLRAGVTMRFRPSITGEGVEVAFSHPAPLSLAITHIGLGTATTPVASRLTDAVLVPVSAELSPAMVPRALVVRWSIPTDIAAGMEVGEIGLVCADGAVAARIAMPAPVTRGAEEWSGVWELVPQATREVML